MHHHLQSRVPQDLFQGVDFASVEQVVDGEGVATEMGVQTGDSRFLGEPGEHQLDGVGGYWLTFRGEEQPAAVGVYWCVPP